MGFLYIVLVLAEAEKNEGSSDRDGRCAIPANGDEIFMPSKTNY